MKTLLILLLGLVLCSCQFPLPEYDLIDPMTIEDDVTLQSVRDAGIESVIDILVEGNYVPDGLYFVTDYNSISAKVVGTTTFYAFDIQVDNFVDYLVDMTFIIVLKPEKQKLLKYTANVTQSVFTEFEAISASEIATSPLISGLGKFGIKGVGQAINAKLPIVSPNFIINETISVQRHVLANKTILFEYNVTANNDKSDSLVSIFVVSYNTTSGERDLFKYSYVVLQEGQSVDSNETNLAANVYTQVFRQEFNEDSKIQNALNFGSQQLVAEALNDNKIQDSDFAITIVNTLYVANPIETRTDYRFDTILTNSDTSTIYAIFLVNHYSVTDEYVLDAYGYTVRTTE